MNTKEIIRYLGGTLNVAYLLDKNQRSVEQWTRSGIPSRYWAQLIRHSDGKITVEQLLTANEKVKNEKLK